MFFPWDDARDSQRHRLKRPIRNFDELSSKLTVIQEKRGMRTLFRLLLPVIYLTALVIPGYVFFASRGGFGFLKDVDYQTASALLFPLFGLYAFTLVWLQFMIGTTRSLLKRAFPGIITWHRTQGVFALLFALVHPALILVAFGIDTYMKKTFVAPELVVYVWIGQVQLFLMVLAVVAALLRRQAWLRSRWKLVHRANYIVFVLAWVHSWFLGSDVQSSGLRWVWIVYAISALSGVAVVVSQARRKSILAPEDAGLIG